MKNQSWKTLAFAGIGLLATAAPALAEENKETKDTPKLSAVEFNNKITQSLEEVRNSGPVVASYADVVEKILPSVVSISTYSKKPQGRMGAPGGFGSEEDIESLPPMFRQFFEDYMQKHGGQMPNSPKGRKAPRGPQGPQQTGLGSGVILTDDGYILTNNHVVEGADELKVVLGGQTKEYIAKVIGADPSTDIALIKIEGTKLPHATIGDSAKLRVGDVVLAAGSPMGLDQSVTHGIVSAQGRSGMNIIGSNKGGQAGYENFIQTDAAINPGNSGGPLVDAFGRVIGINSAIETRSGMFSGIGLAIPINMAIGVVSDLLEGGKVQRGFLGIEMGNVEPSMAEYLGLNDEGGGVTVKTVVENSPAAKAGIEEGDVIITAEGTKVTDPSKLRLMISSKHPGTEVKFGVVRFNETTRKPEHKDVTAKLEILPDKLSASIFEKQGGKGGAKAGGFIDGVKVQNLNDENRQEYAVAEGVEGVLVTAVEENSAAAKVGLQEGDVILQVNRKSVKSVAEARSNKGEAASAVQLKIWRDGQTKFLVVKN